MLTAEQKEERLSGVGASEVAAVLGLNPYQRPIDVAARKLRLVPDDVEESEPARWGNRLEQVIADAYAEEEGIDPLHLISPGTLRDDVHPIAMCTPDRIRVRYDPECPVSASLLMGGEWERNVQIKTTSARVAHRWGDEEDAVPDEYLCQVQWEMFITCLEQTDMPVLLGGNQMRIYRIRADGALQESMVETVERWWSDYIAQGVLPPPDGSPQWSSYLKHRFPKDERPPIEATDDARALVLQLRGAREWREAAELQEEHAKQQIQALIGDAGGIEGLCTWRCNRPSQVTDWRAMAEAIYETAAKLAPHAPTGDAALRSFAEIVQSFTITKPGARVFRLATQKRR